MKKIIRTNEKDGRERMTSDDNSTETKERTAPDKSNDQEGTNIKVTIQTTEGQYERTVEVDNTSNFPLQQRLGLAKYKIPEPPKMMHNIPKYYITKQLSAGQVLKFDIRNPEPTRQLWNRSTELQEKELEDETQECIIETEQEIKARNQKQQKESGKTLGREQPQETNTRGENKNKQRKI